MTGNVVLLGLAIAGLRNDFPDIVRPVRDSLAVAFFLYTLAPVIVSHHDTDTLLENRLGSFVVGRLTVIAGRRRRWMLLTLSFLEAIIFFACTGTLYTHSISDSETDRTSMAVISLLAFAMGSQQIWARDIGVPEVTITVLTNASAQLLGDPKLFTGLGQNHPRNIRFIFIVIFFFGCIVGSVVISCFLCRLCLMSSSSGLMLKHVNLATGLLLTSILKLVAPIFFLVTPNKNCGTVQQI